MCVPGCQETIRRRWSRREFLKVAAGASLGAAVAAGPARRALADGHVGAVHGRPFNRVVDLTHVMDEDFPTYGGGQQLFKTELFNFAEHGFNMYEWTVNEHTGTHMDAPLHFTLDQDSADQIPVDKLVLPLIVVDIKAKAAANADAQVTPDDLRAWERHHGRIPAGACVAMNSGWADHLGTPMFRNADSGGVMHFPGFREDAAAMLIERGAEAIAVDTLSLDFGPSGDFATHYLWLGSNRWGMENVANLDLLPPRGSTIIAGGPKVAGATGGPSRVIALVHPGQGRGVR